MSETPASLDRPREDLQASRDPYGEGARLMDQISPHDKMFTGDLEHYRRVGISAVENVRLALESAGRQSVRSILDFGCGHGRVLRALKEAFPDASLAASDIDRDGVDFCAAAFGATPYYSSPAIDEVRIAETFDLIWCGSVLTHLPGASWHALIGLFGELLEPSGGVLVFTAHGRLVAHRLRTGYDAYGLNDARRRVVLDGFESTGFGYSDYSKQRDYGISLSAPSHVCDGLQKFDQLRLVLFREHGWNDHQDVVAVVRT
jgi:SAM-dependent methyltransferase